MASEYDSLLEEPPKQSEYDALLEHPAAVQERSIPSKIGHAVVDTLKSFLPQSVEEAVTAPIYNFPGVGPVAHALANVAFGREASEGISPVAGIPVVQRIPQIIAAEKTPAYSQERFTTGAGVLADIGMIAAAKPLLRDVAFGKAPEPTVPETPIVEQAAQEPVVAEPIAPPVQEAVTPPTAAPQLPLVEPEPVVQTGATGTGEPPPLNKDNLHYEQNALGRAHKLAQGFMWDGEKWVHPDYPNATPFSSDVPEPKAADVKRELAKIKGEVTEPSIPTEAPQPHEVGDTVKFTEPSVAYRNGQPITVQNNKAGRITLIRPDGKIEIKAQDGGYRILTPEEFQNVSKETPSVPVAESVPTAPLSTETIPTTGEPNAKQEPSTASVTEPEIRPRVGEETPLRQPGEIAVPREETPILEVQQQAGQVAPEVSGIEEPVAPNLPTGTGEAVTGQPFSTTAYHGTRAADQLDPEFLGLGTGAKSAKQAFFFSSNKELAQDYADTAFPKEGLDARRSLINAEAEQQKLKETFDVNLPEDQQNAMHARYAELDKVIDDAKETITKHSLERGRRMELGGLSGDADARVLEHPVQLQNPYVVDFHGSDFREKTYSDILEQAKKAGHDGVIFKNTYDPASVYRPDRPTDIYAVFPETLKAQSVPETHVSTTAETSQEIPTPETPIAEQPKTVPTPPITEVGAADEPHVSAIANKFTKARTESGELGEIAPGQGYSTREMADAGLKMPPEQITQHISDLMNDTGNPVEQGKAVRAEEARLSQRSNELSRVAANDPTNVQAKLDADNAFKDVTDFHNGPIAKLKTIFHGTGMGLQGELPIDLSTFNGMREAWLKDNGKPPPPEVEPQLKRMAEKLDNSIKEDNGAKQTLGQAIEKATAKRKLPSYDEVRQNLMDRIKEPPCRT